MSCGGGAVASVAFSGPHGGLESDVIVSSLNHTFPSPGNTPDNSSSTMAFLALLVAAGDVFSPLLNKGPPNTSKRAPEGIYGAFLIVGVVVIKIDVRRYQTEIQETIEGSVLVFLGAKSSRLGDEADGDDRTPSGMAYHADESGSLQADKRGVGRTTIHVEGFTGFFCKLEWCPLTQTM